MSHPQKNPFLFTLILSMLFVNSVFSQQVKIGTQIWTNVDLDVTTFRNGENIPEAKTPEEWQAAGAAEKPAWRLLPHKESQNEGPWKTVYKKVYNWYAVNDPRGLAPSGWHIPSDADWHILFLNQGWVTKSTETCLKSDFGWSNNGKNSSHFNGTPNTYCDGKGKYGDITQQGAAWWSATDQHTLKLASCYFLGGGSYGDTLSKLWGLDGITKMYGLAVRCIKNGPQYIEGNKPAAQVNKDDDDDDEPSYIEGDKAPDQVIKNDDDDEPSYIEGDDLRAILTNITTDPRYGSYDYHGATSNGIPNGYGLAKFNSGDKIGDQYLGFWVDGYFQGKGQYTYASGSKSVYTGDFVHGLREGQGVMEVRVAGASVSGVYGCTKYVGGFKAGLKSGNGKCYNDEGTLIYDGNFENGKPTQPYPTYKRPGSPAYH